MTAAHADMARIHLTPELRAAIEAWTAANLRARRAYYAAPNACTRAIWSRSWR